LGVIKYIDKEINHGKMKFLLIIILLLPLKESQGQTAPGAYWGISINTHLLLEKDAGSPAELLPPPDFYLHFKPVLMKYLQTDLYAGYIIFTEAWNGFDFGFNLRSRLFKKVALLIGMNRFHVTGGMHGNSVKYIYKGNAAFNFLNLGLDYYMSRNGYVEFIYSPVISSNKVFGFNENVNKTMRLTGKVEFGLGWDLPF
jgi:hypothetical protein